MGPLRIFTPLFVCVKSYTLPFFLWNNKRKQGSHLHEKSSEAWLWRGRVEQTGWMRESDPSNDKSSNEEFASRIEGNWQHSTFIEPRGSNKPWEKLSGKRSWAYFRSKKNIQSTDSKYHKESSSPCLDVVGLISPAAAFQLTCRTRDFKTFKCETMRTDWCQTPSINNILLHTQMYQTDIQS